MKRDLWMNMALTTQQEIQHHPPIYNILVMQLIWETFGPAKPCFPFPKPPLKMQFFFHIALLFIFYTPSFSIPITNIHYPVSRRGLTAPKQTPPIPTPDIDHLLDEIKVDVDPTLKFDNPRLKNAYCALQEWKKAMISDPFNMTGNWVGPDVCSYYGVVCVQALDDESIKTVAGVDLNFGDISGQLVPHLGLLTDLGILHLHSNRFCGLIPKTFATLQLLYELDLSNNRLSGRFPTPLLTLSSLHFLDIRFNELEGPIPPELFNMEVDAIVVNNNRFSSHLPKNIGNSPASTLVLANNKLSGCIPRSIGRMPNLEQVSFANNRLTGCLPEELGGPKYLTFLDVSKNYFLGPLPRSLERLKSIERVDFSNNHLTGKVHDSFCSLPELWNMTIFDNFFNEIGDECEKLMNDKLIMNDTYNCFPRKQNQKPQKECLPVVTHPVDCKTIGCQPKDPTILDNIRKRTPPRPMFNSPPQPPPPSKRNSKNVSPKTGS